MSYVTSPEPNNLRRKPGPKPVITPNQRGKLLVSLACGLTQREAAVWVQCKQSTLSLLVRQNEEFKFELREDTTKARLHPYLRLYQAGGESWRAAVRLVAHMERTQGRLTTDELLAGIRLLLDKSNVFERGERSA